MQGPSGTRVALYVCFVGIKTRPIAGEAFGGLLHWQAGGLSNSGSVWPCLSLYLFELGCKSFSLLPMVQLHTACKNRCTNRKGVNTCAGNTTSTENRTKEHAHRAHGGYRVGKVGKQRKENYAERKDEGAGKSLHRLGTSTGPDFRDYGRPREREGRKKERKKEANTAELGKERKGTNVERRETGTNE